LRRPSQGNVSILGEGQEVWSQHDFNEFIAIRAETFENRMTKLVNKYALNAWASMASILRIKVCVQS
jgi:hypothetical protein